jgi:hypothetical protein
MKRSSPAAVSTAPSVPSIPPTQVLPRLAALRTAPIAELKEQWRTLYGKEPPAVSRSYIESRLAYRIQELAYGGLRPETRKRLEALGERLDGGNAVLRRIRADSRPLPGTQLIREYDGVQHVVTVGAGEDGRRIATKADPALVKGLARAFRYQKLLDEGRYASISEMAAAEKIERGYLGTLLRLTLLAPAMVEAILNGRQPAWVTLPALLEGVPVGWGKQQENLLSRAPTRVTKRGAWSET